MKFRLPRAGDGPLGECTTTSAMTLVSRQLGYRFWSHCKSIQDRVASNAAANAFVQPEIHVASRFFCVTPESGQSVDKSTRAFAFISCERQSQTGGVHDDPSE